MSLFEQLGTLESAGLLRVARVEPDLEYLFRHALVQDAAYASLLDSDRKRLHKVVGEAVENLYQGRLDEFAAVLSIHFARAGDDLRALRYSAQAGDAALATYANREAEIHYRRALRLTCPECERVHILRGLGEALYRLGRLDEALATWQEGIELYKNLGDLDGAAFLYSRSARVAWHSGDHPQGLRLSQEGLAAISGVPDSSDVAMLIHEAARACHFNGLQEKAYHLCRKALEMAERLGAVEVQADTLATYAVLPQISPEESVNALRKAVELAETSGYLGIAVRAYHNLGATITAVQESQETARQYYLRAAELGRQRGVVAEQLLSLMGAVGVTLEMGRLAEAEEMIDQMTRLAAQMPDHLQAGLNTQLVRASLLWMRGEWDEALYLYRICQEEARQRGDLQQIISVNNSLASALLELNLWQDVQPWEEVEAVLDEAIELSERGLGKEVWPRVQMAITYARQDRLAAAWEQLEHARQVSEQQPANFHELALLLGETELFAAEGRYTEALEAVEKAVNLHTRFESQWGRARALQDWARVHMLRRELTDLEKARALLGEALSTFQSMGALRHAAVVEEWQQRLRSETYQLALASQADAQELARAARVQESFLPEHPPQLPGWDLQVSLVPARRTSGDFYDFIPLPNNRLAVVVADVADKGAGAALFMTTTRSLLRTYASDYAMWPELVLAETNRRMLADTHGGLFVTMFYSVLDPVSGLLTYCNAGHNPPFWLPAADPQEILSLNRTGPPLGIFEENTWQQGTIQLALGDVLVVYTDGVTEAINPEEEPFGEQGLRAALREHRQANSTRLRDGILQAVRQFSGTAPQFDDITLLVLQHKESTT